MGKTTKSSCSNLRFAITWFWWLHLSPSSSQQLQAGNRFGLWLCDQSINQCWTSSLHIKTWTKTLMQNSKSKELSAVMKATSIQKKEREKLQRRNWEVCTSLVKRSRETHCHGDTLHVYEQGCRINDLDRADVCLLIQATCLHVEMWLRGVRVRTHTHTHTHAQGKSVQLFLSSHGFNAQLLWDLVITKLAVIYLVGLL